MSRFVSNKLRTVFLDTEDYSKKSLEELKDKIKEIVKNNDLWLRGDENKEELIFILDNRREWIKIPEAISYEHILASSKIDNIEEASKMMLVNAIKEWNLKDDNGNIPKVNEENILKLDITTVTFLTEEVTKLYIPKISNIDNKKK